MNKLVKILSVFFLLSIANTSLASLKDFYFERFKNSAVISPKSASVETGFFQQRINHFEKANKGTFKQRYYINRRFSRNHRAPVFLYICGESSCHSRSIERGAIVEHAKKFGAILIALEHRYYGISIPFKNLKTQNLKFLSTEQALYDLERFQISMTKKLGLRKEWITFGGSYPGSLSAYYRLKFPSLVKGALASSAPVRADDNFDEYDKHVSDVVGPYCGALMKEAVFEIESAMDSPKKWNEYLKLFGAREVKNKVDFLYIIADIGAIAAQYGYVKKFCRYLEMGETAVLGYAKFSAYIMKAWGMKPAQLAVEWAKNTDPKTYLNSFGMRQWYYQSCTEYGYWQNAHPTKSVRSKKINAEYHKRVCKRLFNIDRPVNIHKINNNFYYPLLNPAYASEIYFTNGDTDPWLKLSLNQEIIQNNNQNLSSYLIHGAAHCDDLRSSKKADSKELTLSRYFMEKKIDKWLE